MSSSKSPVRALTTQESNSMQAELEHEKDRLKLLLDMTNTLVSNLELRDLLRAISASIRQDMHCDSVGVWLPDSERRQLRQLAQDFPESKEFVTEDLLHPIEGSEVGTVFKTGKPFVLRTQADVTSEWGTSAVRAEFFKSGYVLPLISRNRTLGVLGLCSRVEHAFSPEDVDFLMRAAGQVAIAVENALAYREIPFFPFRRGCRGPRAKLGPAILPRMLPTTKCPRVATDAECRHIQLAGLMARAESHRTAGFTRSG